MSALPLLFTLAFVVYVDIRIIAPVLPSISASLGGTPGQVGFAMTTYSLAYGSEQLVYGPLSDRYGRVAVVRLAGLRFAVGTALSALAATTWQFVGARLLAGAFAGAVIPLTVVFIGDSSAIAGASQRMRTKEKSARPWLPSISAYAMIWACTGFDSPETWWRI